jgi:hypothetical protein
LSVQIAKRGKPDTLSVRFSLAESPKRKCGEWCSG